MNQVFELPHEWILTIKNGDKKEYEGFKCGWSNSRANEELEIAKYQGQNVIGITRNISLKNGIVVIDIDENCPYQDIIRQYPFLKGTLHVKGNTKGHHIYVKWLNVLARSPHITSNIYCSFQNFEWMGGWQFRLGSCEWVIT